MAGADVPIVTIEMFEGRTPDQKSRLHREVSAAVADCAGCAVGDVRIIIREMQRENYSVGGRSSIASAAAAGAHEGRDRT